MLQCVPGISSEEHIPGNKKLQHNSKKHQHTSTKHIHNNTKHFYFNEWRHQILCILKCVAVKRRKIRKRKVSILVHKETVAILSSSNWVAGNNVVGIEENSYKSDHKILPRGKRRVLTMQGPYNELWLITLGLAPLLVGKNLK